MSECSDIDDIRGITRCSFLGFLWLQKRLQRLLIHAECSFPLVSGLSVPPPASVSEPEEDCEPENLFFGQDLPITAGRGGAWGWKDTCAGREAGSDFGSGAGERAAAGLMEVEWGLERAPQ